MNLSIRVMECFCHWVHEKGYLATLPNYSGQFNIWPFKQSIGSQSGQNQTVSGYCQFNVNRNVRIRF